MLLDSQGGGVNVCCCPGQGVHLLSGIVAAVCATTSSNVFCVPGGVYGSALPELRDFGSGLVALNMPLKPFWASVS